MELNGKKLMGLPLKLDKARTKESSQENKKGTIIAALHVNHTRSDGLIFLNSRVGIR